MRLIIALLLALVLSVPNAIASDPWVLVAKTERSNFYIYRGSLDVGTASNGARVFYVAGKYEIVADKQAMLQVWYVPVQDCIVSSGKMYIMDPNGKEITNIDFKPGDESAGASIARLICNAALNLTNDFKNRI